MSKTLTGGKVQMVIIPAWVKNDIYWRSSIMILQAMAEREPKFLPLTQRFVNFEESTIDFFAMKRAISSWSHSEKIMVKLAAHLFNQSNKFDLGDLDYLDEENSKVALSAISSRYGKN